jgi:hypothetical protein
MSERGVPERAARYDAWLATSLGQAMDAAEALAVFELAAPSPGERVLDAAVAPACTAVGCLHAGSSSAASMPTRPRRCSPI